MPSFDIVSEVDTHELNNAIDNTKRELYNRFDFKGSSATVTTPENNAIHIVAEDEFRCNQLFDILKVKMVQRGLDIHCLRTSEPQKTVSQFKLPISIIEGIEQDLGRKLTRLVKDTRLKVQCQIQQEQIRVSGKKKNDLQLIIKKIQDYKFNYPLQFKNFRD